TKSFRPAEKFFPVFIYLENTPAFSVPADQRSHPQLGAWQGSRGYKCRRCRQSEAASSAVSGFRSDCCHRCETAAVPCNTASSLNPPIFTWTEKHPSHPPIYPIWDAWDGWDRAFRV